MSLRAVQKNNPDKSSRKNNYINYLSAGAVGGYALKWLIPLTKQEKDSLFLSGLKKIAVESVQAKRDEIEIIRTTKPKIDGADTFIKMYDNKKLHLGEIKKLKQPLSNKVMQLYLIVNNKSKDVKEVGYKKLVDSTKGLRPTGVFIILGICVGALIAFMKNLPNQNASTDTN
jgi:hypothetical protein